MQFYLFSICQEDYTAKYSQPVCTWALPTGWYGPDTAPYAPSVSWISLTYRAVHTCTFYIPVDANDED